LAGPGADLDAVAKRIISAEKTNFGHRALVTIPTELSRFRRKMFLK